MLKCHRVSSHCSIYTSDKWEIILNVILFSEYDSVTLLDWTIYVPHRVQIQACSGGVFDLVIYVVCTAYFQFTTVVKCLLTLLLLKMLDISAYIYFI